MTPEEFAQQLANYTSTFDNAGVLTNDGQDSEETNLTVLVPEGAVPVLIGAAGANIKQIKGATGCEISFCKKDEAVNGLRKCFHKGPIAGITKAVYVLCNFVERNELSIVVKANAAGAVIGKAGSTLKSVREQTGCNTNFDKEAVPAFAGRVLTMRYPEDGSHPAPITKAIYMTLRVPGFDSPTQNDCRQSMRAPPPQFDVYQQDPMGQMMGVDPSFAYGPAAGNGAKQRFNPYGAPPPRGGEGDGNTCGIHGSRRGKQNLQPHPFNSRIMVCLEHDQCKGANALANAARVCFTHGKKRGEQNLQPHTTAPGVFVCHDQDQCKTSRRV